MVVQRSKKELLLVLLFVAWIVHYYVTKNEQRSKGSKNMYKIKVLFNTDFHLTSPMFVDIGSVKGFPGTLNNRVA